MYEDVISSHFVSVMMTSSWLRKEILRVSRGLGFHWSSKSWAQVHNRSKCTSPHDDVVNPLLSMGSFMYVPSSLSQKGLGYSVSENRNRW